MSQAVHLIRSVRPGTLIASAILCSLAVALAIAVKPGFIGVAVLIGGVGALTYMGYAFSRPFYLLLPVLAGSFLGDVVQLVQGGAIPFSLFQLALVASLGVFVLHKLACRDLNTRLVGWELEWMLFLAWIFFSMMYSRNAPNGALYVVRVMVLLVYVYFILNVVQSRRHMRIAMLVITVICLGLAVYSIRYSLFNPENAIRTLTSFGARFEGRASAAQNDPNRFATFFFLPIAFLAAIAHSKFALKWRVVSMLAIGILLGGLLSTYSRSAWVSSFLMVGLIALAFRNFKIALYLLGALILAAVAVPELRVTVINVAERLSQIFSGASDASSRIRIYLGIAGVLMFADSWMLGVGIRGYPVEFWHYYTPKEAIGVNEHNVGDVEGLADILLYHVVGGRKVAEIVLGQESLTTLQGGSLTVDAENVALIDANHRA